jgi:hypothetical protein
MIFVATEAHAENEQEQRAADQPQQLAAVLVGAVKIGLPEMQKQDDDHDARAVRVQAAQKGARRDLLLNERDGRVRVIGRRHVIEREEDAGDRLVDEDEEEAAAEDVGPARFARDRLVEALVHQLVPADAALEPFARGAHPMTSRFAES